MNKKQISLWLPKDLVDLLDQYLMDNHRRTGKLNHRVEYVKEAIIEKLSVDGVFYED